MDQLEQLKKDYWKVVSRTRQSGRISKSVIEKQETYWQQFDQDVIAEALRIHISNYQSYKESYTRGIMRNLQDKKSKTGKVGKENSFNDFKQNSYDFDVLERELLCN